MLREIREEQPLRRITILIATGCLASAYQEN